MSTDTSTAVHGSPFVIDDGHTDGAPRTRVKASKPFQFCAHPERWAVQGGKVRPMLTKGLKIYPGVHNMTRGRGGRVRGVAAARAHKESRGRIVIPLDAIPDSHADADGSKSYLYSPDGRPDVVLDIYTHVFPGTARKQCDVPRWYEFLDHLVDSGVVPECPTYVLERMLADEERKAGRAADKAHTAPSYAIRAKHHSDAVESIRALLDERNAAARPVRRRKVALTEDEA